MDGDRQAQRQTETHGDHRGTWTHGDTRRRRRCSEVHRSTETHEGRQTSRGTQKHTEAHRDTLETDIQDRPRHQRRSRNTECTAPARSACKQRLQARTQARLRSTSGLCLSHDDPPRTSCSSKSRTEREVQEGRPSGTLRSHGRRAPRPGRGRRRAGRRAGRPLGAGRDLALGGGHRRGRRLVSPSPRSARPVRLGRAPCAADCRTAGPERLQPSRLALTDCERRGAIPHPLEPPATCAACCGVLQRACASLSLSLTGQAGWRFPSESRRG